MSFKNGISIADVKRETTDVCIIGAGAAGVRAAYEAKQQGVKDITLLSKGRFIHSGSSFFSLVHGWGMQASMPGLNPEDSPEDHLRETLERGLGVTNEALARVLVEEAGDRVRDLEELGLEFRGHEGKISQIVGCFSKGRRAIGAINMESTRKVFRQMVAGDEVTIHEHFMVLDLIVEDGKCLGVVGLNKEGQLTAIAAKTCIIASGGGTAVFKHSLQSGECTGDTYGLALRAGLPLFNIEFIQSIYGIVYPKHLIFSERAMFYDPDVTNKNGQRFVEKYLPEKVEYKDVLRERITHGPFSSEGISRWFDISTFKEIRKGLGTERDAVKVDLKDYWRMQQEDKDNVNIQKWCDFTDVWISWLKGEHGVDVEQQPLEIDHASHAMNGGVKADTETRTEIPNLFVCGEALAGPHGADRLGGNMMTGTQVFGARAGKYAARTCKEDPALEGRGEERLAQSLDRALNRYNSLINSDGVLTAGQQRQKLQELMWRDAHIVRNEEGLLRAKAGVTAMLEELPDVEAPDSRALREKVSLENMFYTSLAIIEAALNRRETRGPHYREDYPERDESLEKPIYLRWDGKKVTVKEET